MLPSFIENLTLIRGQVAEPFITRIQNQGVLFLENLSRDILLLFFDFPCVELMDFQQLTDGFVFERLAEPILMDQKSQLDLS